MGKIRKTFIAKTFKITTVALLAATSFATAASATTFDGEWSVHIASSNSTCGNGQTVSIGINNGQVSSSMVQASGHVADAGSISVTLVSGIKRATGFGRLSATSGSGTWRGTMCSGTWTASRI
jgi:FtsH-binding integral membrane protein